MGFRHFGWACIVVGVLMTSAAFFSSTGIALLATLLGAGLVVMGLLFLWFASMEGGGVYSGARWSTRSRAQR